MFSDLHPIINRTESKNEICMFGIFFFFFFAMQLVGSQFPDLGLNQDHGSETLGS